MLNRVHSSPNRVAAAVRVAGNLRGKLNLPVDSDDSMPAYGTLVFNAGMNGQSSNAT
jgi:hypothetical protein